MKIPHRPLKDNKQIADDIILAIRRQRQHYALQVQYDIAMDGKQIVYMRFARALPSGDLMLMSAAVINERQSSEMLSIAENRDKPNQLFPLVSFDKWFVWRYAATRVKGLEPFVIGGAFDEYLKSKEK